MVTPIFQNHRIVLPDDSTTLIAKLKEQFKADEDLVLSISFADLIHAIGIKYKPRPTEKMTLKVLHVAFEQPKLRGDTAATDRAKKLNECGNNGLNMLHMVLFWSPTEQSLELVKFLFGQGANPYIAGTAAGGNFAGKSSWDMLSKQKGARNTVILYRQLRDIFDLWTLTIPELPTTYTGKALARTEHMDTGGRQIYGVLASNDEAKQGDDIAPSVGSTFNVAKEAEEEHLVYVHYGIKKTSFRPLELLMGNFESWLDVNKVTVDSRIWIHVHGNNVRHAIFSVPWQELTDLHRVLHY